MNDWLLQTFAVQGRSTLYRAVMFAHDALVTVALAVPFAILFIVFRQMNHWCNLLVAALAAVIVAYWGANWGAIGGLVANFDFWFGLTLTLGSLPVAFAVLRFGQARRPALR